MTPGERVEQLKGAAMARHARRARVNFKALVILVVVVLVLGVAGIGGYYVRKRVTAQSALEEGRAALAQNDFANAARLLRRYLDQYPDDIEILEKYAGAELRVRPRTADRVSKAIGSYRRLLRHRADDEALIDRLSRLYLLGRNAREVIQICQTRLSVNPGDVRATVNLGRAFLVEEKPSDAKGLLGPFVEKHPETVEAYGLLASATLAMDASPEGVEAGSAWLNTCVERNPESPRAVIQRGQFHGDHLSHRKAPDVDAARADFLRAEQLGTTDPELLLALAQAWVILGDLTRGETGLAAVAAINDEALIEDDLDPDKYLLDRLLLKAAWARQDGDPVKMAEIAQEGLTALSGGYRSAYLESAIELLLSAQRLDEAAAVLGDYRELVTGVREGSTTTDERLTLFSARLAFAQNRPYDVVELLEPLVTRNPKSYPGWRLLAQSYIATGQTRRGIAALESCVQIRPESTEAAMQLAKQHLKLGHWDQSVQYARMLSRDDLEANLIRVEATLLRAIEEKPEPSSLEWLARELETLRAAYPKSAAPRMLAASLAENQGRIDDAIGAYREAIETCTDTLEPALQLSQMYRRQGRMDDAIAAARSATAAHPDAARAWVMCADHQVRAEQLDAAMETLGQALVSLLEPRQIREINMATARLHLRRGEREKAIAVYRQVAESDAQDTASRVALLELPEIHESPEAAQRLVDELKRTEGSRAGLQWRIHQARVWLSSGDWRNREKEIMALLQFCIDADPTWTRPALIMGRTYELLGDNARAEAAYRRLLSVRFDAIDVTDRLLRLLEKQNRVAEAKEVMDRLPENLPGLGDHRADIAVRAGEFETAIRELQNLTASDPNDAESRIMLARLIFAEQKDVGEALRLLDEAIRIEPHSLSASAIRAQILLADQRGDEASAVIDKLVTDRGDFGAYVLRGQFRLARDDAPGAEEDYRRLTTLPESAGAGYEILGRFYVAQKRIDEALAVWTKGLEIEPGREAMERLLMKLLLSSEDTANRERGGAILDRLQQQSPDDAELLADRARILLRDGTAESMKEAEALLERIVERDVRAVQAHLALVQLKSARGELDAAGAIVTRSLAGNPENPDLLMAQAELERARGNMDRAAEIAEAVLVKDPERAAAYIILTDAAVAANDLDRAMEMIEKAVARSPESATAQVKRAALLRLRGSLDEGISSLEQFTGSDMGRSSEAAFLALAEMYCEKGDDPKFDACLAQVEQLSPGHRGGFQNRVRCLAGRQRFAEIVPLLAARQSAHADDTGSILLGATLLAAAPEQVHRRGALRLFEEAAVAKPSSVEAHLGVAQVSYSLDDVERTESAYRRVLELSPNHAQALNDLAWILANNRSDLPGAIKLADQGVKQNPDDPHLRDTRGVILTRMDRLTDAENDLLLAGDLAESARKPATQAQSLIHLADVREKLGDADGARGYLKQALVVDSRHHVLGETERAAVEARIGG
ncbi:MAG: tetratricopeptide repeat protein [Phycisphaerales bacterium]|nr:tetratricopeptide repeat protein [Phycisphaerales bacterium]